MAEFTRGTRVKINDKYPDEWALGLTGTIVSLPVPPFNWYVIELDKRLPQQVIEENELLEHETNIMYVWEREMEAL